MENGDCLVKWRERAPPIGNFIIMTFCEQGPAKGELNYSNRLAVGVKAEVKYLDLK